MSISGCGIVHDLVSKEDMRRMVGDDFSESSWDSIAGSRDKIPRSEIMDLVQEQLQLRASSSHSQKSKGELAKGSIRSEVILSFLMSCDRGGKQLLASYPTMAPRKGGSGADKREGTLRMVRETSGSDLRRVFMEIEARLCMADQRGIDVDLDSGLTDKLLVTLSSMDGSKLGIVCEALLKFAAADKGDNVRQLNKEHSKKGSQKEISGGSDETKVLIQFVDDVLAIIKEQQASRLLACKVVGHAFQLITGLLVDKCPSAKFAEASGGKVFDSHNDDDDDDGFSDMKELEGQKFTSRLSAPLHHEVMVSELKERGNRCMKKKDYTGAVNAYTSALGQGLWVEQAMELVAEMARRSDQSTPSQQAKYESTEEAVQAILEEQSDEVDQASRDLLISHSKTAAALLANRSLALTQLDKPADALKDARLCLRCAPTWPKAHFRIAVALKLLGKVNQAISVLQAGLENLPQTADDRGWVKEFEREIGVCKSVSQKVKNADPTELHPIDDKEELPPLTAADWKYSDIMSWQFATFIVILMLIAGYLGSLMLLSFAFSASMATIFGAPDPRRARFLEAKKQEKAQRNKEGLGDDEEEEEDMSVYETEAGRLLSQWMAGGSGSIRGLPKRNSQPDDDDDDDDEPSEPRTTWLPPVAEEALRLSNRKKQATSTDYIQPSPKISKLSKIEKLD